MKALTIWQPWATLIIEGFKPREFRPWAAPPSIVGHRIVLHAAVRPIKATELQAIIEYVCSAAGVADGIDPRAMDLLERAWMRTLDLPLAAGLGTAQLGTPRIVGTSDGGKSTWAWPMIDVEKWPTPVPAKGAQGFWEWKGN